MNFDPYEVLRVRAQHEVAYVVVGGFADVVRSKEAAGRPKDRAALPLLRALLRRQQGS